jgi:four helix bundle protein
MRDVKNYEVFRTADRLVLDIYRLTGSYPKSEAFGLVAQMRRAAASIPMNLAEGAARAGAREFGQFVNISIGSCEEIRYQLHLSEALGFIPEPTRLQLDREYESVKKMLVRLLQAIGRQPLAVSRKPLSRRSVNE